MKLKLANLDSIDSNIEKTIALKDIEEELSKKDTLIFYLDGSNSIKDIQKLKVSLEKNVQSVYCNEIKHGMDKDNLIYELHIIK